MSSGVVANSFRMTKVFLLYYRQFFGIEFVYRTAMIQRLVSQTISFGGILMFWLAAHSTGIVETGISKGALVGYFIAASLHYILHENELLMNISSDIRMGRLSASLVRPFPYLLIALSRAMAISTTRYITLGLIVLIIFLIVPILKEDLILTMTVERLSIYIVSLVISLIVATLLKVFVGLLAFFIVQTWGPEILYTACVFALSGLSYPVHLAPDWLHAIIVWSPFYFMIGLPNLALTGMIDSETFLSQMLNAVVVIAYLTALVKIVWDIGISKFEAIGI